MKLGKKTDCSICPLHLGSHDRRSLQLPPQMYYYASPTLRSETMLPLKREKEKEKRKQSKTEKTKKQNKNEEKKKRKNTHVILQTSPTASKRLRIRPKGCIHLKHFKTSRAGTI